jgi:hypothetical protein
MPALGLVGLLRRRPENLHANDATGQIEIKIGGGADDGVTILTRNIDEDTRRNVIHTLMSTQEGEGMVVATRLRKFESEVGQITVFVDRYGGFDGHPLVDDAATFFFHHVGLEVYVILESDRRVEVAPFYLDRHMSLVQDKSLISSGRLFYHNKERRVMRNSVI